MIWNAGSAGRRIAAIGRAAVALALSASAGVSAADQDRRSWTDFNGAPDNSKYSTLRLLNLAWVQTERHVPICRWASWRSRCRRNSSGSRRSSCV